MAATFRLALAVLLCTGAGCASSAGGWPRSPLPKPIQLTVRAAEPWAASSPADSLTVATYNVRGLRKRAAVRADMTALPDVAVWCLQEVPHGKTSDVGSFLPPGPWHVAIVPVNRVGAKPPRWEAQVIASRFPLDRVDVWPLDDAGLKRRVALAARVRVNDRRVLVVNTDHEPSILALRDGNAIQTRALAKRLRGVNDADAVVAAGDFNCSGNLFRLRGNAAHVRSVDETLAATGVAPLATREPTFRSGVVRSRLDRIYVRNLTPRTGAVATGSRGSDHLPVWGRFDFPPPAPDRAISDPPAAQ